MTEETKQLDAHDALLLMAEAFDGADEKGRTRLDGILIDCLCLAISGLQVSKRISKETANQLRGMIYELTSTQCGTYLFPRTREGARQRAAWCREQAAKLRPVEGPKVCDEAPKVRTVADARRKANHD